MKGAAPAGPGGEAAAPAEPEDKPQAKPEGELSAGSVEPEKQPAGPPGMRTVVKMELPAPAPPPKEVPAEEAPLSAAEYEEFLGYIKTYQTNVQMQRQVLQRGEAVEKLQSEIHAFFESLGDDVCDLLLKKLQQQAMPDASLLLQEQELGRAQAEGYEQLSAQIRAMKSEVQTLNSIVSQLAADFESSSATGGKGAEPLPNNSGAPTQNIVMISVLAVLVMAILVIKIR